MFFSVLNEVNDIENLVQIMKKDLKIIFSSYSY